MGNQRKMDAADTPPNPREILDDDVMVIAGPHTMKHVSHLPDKRIDYGFFPVTAFTCEGINMGTLFIDKAMTDSQLHGLSFHLIDTIARGIDVARQELRAVEQNAEAYLEKYPDGEKSAQIERLMDRLDEEDETEPGIMNNNIDQGSTDDEL